MRGRERAAHAALGGAKVGYFAELMTANEDVHDSIRPLLKQISYAAGPLRLRGMILSFCELPNSDGSSKEISLPPPFPKVFVRCSIRP